MLGGNKSLLFNAEYLINIAGPVRLVLFYDAGQVRDIGEHFAWKEDRHGAAVPAAAHRRSALLRSVRDRFAAEPARRAFRGSRPS